MSLIHLFCLRRRPGQWFYNPPMHSPTLSLATLVLLCLLAPGVSTAQAPAAEKRLEQRIEHIRVEDGGSRIDEVRVGGETQSITVSPKGSMPSYDVLPASANRVPSAGERNSASASGGTRVWKILGV